MYNTKKTETTSMWASITILKIHLVGICIHKMVNQAEQYCNVAKS